MSHWILLAAATAGLGAVAVTVTPDLRRYLDFSRM
ncbi:hypothetical protein Ga0074812_11614 [Parafrankia irregularis]|uniref:Uncharacterized protein n=1 Tax=Parafrankia irregularis TaxID=795642 RepID=A0A0S4QSI4_9ACTN|nr:hypothetical protein Ga0074812_11614 [Parafrankia irregularis]